MINEHFSITNIRIDQFEIVYRNKLFTAQQSDIFELEILCIFLVSVCAAIPGPSDRCQWCLTNICWTFTKRKGKKNYGELIFGSLMMVWYVMANRTYRTRLRALILYILHGGWYNIVPLLVRSFCMHFFYRIRSDVKYGSKRIVTLV